MGRFFAACLAVALGLSVAPLPAQAQDRVTKSCGSCDRGVSSSSMVGMRCPHCGVRWGHESTRWEDSGRPYDPGPAPGPVPPPGPSAPPASPGPPDFSTREIDGDGTWTPDAVPGAGAKEGALDARVDVKRDPEKEAREEYARLPRPIEDAVAGEWVRFSYETAIKSATPGMPGPMKGESVSRVTGVDKEGVDVVTATTIAGNAQSTTARFTRGRDALDEMLAAFKTGLQEMSLATSSVEGGTYEISGKKFKGWKVTMVFSGTLGAMPASNGLRASSGMPASYGMIYYLSEEVPVHGLLEMDCKMKMGGAAPMETTMKMVMVEFGRSK